MRFIILHVSTAYHYVNSLVLAFLLSIYIYVSTHIYMCIHAYADSPPPPALS